MHYEINVSRNGIHFFATAEQSLTNTQAAIVMYATFIIKFPPSEGYRVIVSERHITGKYVTDEIDKAARTLKLIK